MINTLKVILEQMPNSSQLLRVEYIAEALDIALRNIKEGDDIADFMNNEDIDTWRKALVESIINYVDSNKSILPQVDKDDLLVSNIDSKVTVVIYIRQDLCNNKMGLIKAIRELNTALSLKEAKDFADSIDWQAILGPIELDNDSKNKIIKFMQDSWKYSGVTTSIVEEKARKLLMGS